jgi:hypothetical protein
VELVVLEVVGMVKENLLQLLVLLALLIQAEVAVVALT